MTPLVALIIVLPVLAFYVWMVLDMTNNDSLPAGAGPALRWPPVSKSDWTVAFILLSLPAAAYYYFTEYRKNR